MSKTAWPVVTDVLELLNSYGVTLSTAVTTTVQNNVLNAVIDGVSWSTKRTWIAVDETRFFDGSGTGELVIDDYITVSAVSVFTMWGSVLTLNLQHFEPVKVNTYPMDRIYIYRGPVLGYARYFDRFPIGRRNISVTAKWGFATTIPGDLWLAVNSMAAAILANSDIYKENASAFLIKIQEADVSEVRQMMKPTEWIKSIDTYERVCKKYKRRDTRLLNSWRRDII